MDLKLLLCFAIISPILAQFPNWGQNPQTPQQLMAVDRARSVWNFNQPSNQRVAINQSPKQSVPGALRRQGINPKAITTGRKKKLVRSSKAPVPLPRPRHNLKSKPGKMQKSKSRNIHPKKAAPPQTYQPHPFHKQQISGPPRWLRRRASRKINPRKDSILTRFRKEDLWHLDKGEGYPLKTEDLLNDHFQRRQTTKSLETNEIFDEDHYKEYSHDEEDHHHDHEENHQHLEEQAEKLINKAEGVVCNKNHETGESNAPTHLHHHHHYAEGSVTPAPKKVPNETLILPTLPRIHNPIPLGCLLTWPIFHPIRPRNHLACLLSIPGTPNLLKRRRRSAEFQEEEQPSANRRSYSSSKFPFGLTNQLKVPATVIAPPQFEKSDLLSMLMGSGGISPKNMGTVLATNSRYVRFGRGFPNRQGRTNWYPVSRPVPGAHQTNSNPNQPSTSSSNHMPSVVKPQKVNPPLVVNVHFNPGSKPSQPVSPRPLTSHKAPVYKASLKKQKWKPIYRAKSRRPYHYYDIYSSESKQSFSKVKPMKSLQESIEEAHQSIADDSLEDDIEMDEDLVLESPEFNYDESPAELEEEPEQDLTSTSTIEETQKKPDIKTFSFAIKKNRDTPVLVFKDEDEASSIPSPLDADTDEVAESEGEGTDVAYYYKLVRKLAGDIEDPIIINVPKEVSNEVKK